jgi:hypothetical protein
MKTRRFVIISMMALTGIVGMWSCKDDDDDKTVTKEDAVVVAKNDAVSDAVYEDVYTESEEIMSDLESSKYPAAKSLKSTSMTGSRTVTVVKNSGDSTTFPKEIVIVYSGYQSYSGITKNGTIKVTQTERIRRANAVRTITFENFTVNDTIKVEGKTTVTNKGLVNGKPSIQVQLSDGKLTYSSGYYVTRNFTRTITWVEGFTTPFNIWNDVYSIETTSSGSTKNGFSYSTKTTVPLEYKVSDFCIKKGKIEVNVEGQKMVYIDFTRTDCANKIKLMIEGDTQEIDVW